MSKLHFGAMGRLQNSKQLEVCRVFQFLLLSLSPLCSQGEESDRCSVRCEREKTLVFYPTEGCFSQCFLQVEVTALYGRSARCTSCRTLVLSSSLLINLNMHETSIRVNILLVLIFRASSPRMLETFYQNIQSSESWALGLQINKSSTMMTLIRAFSLHGFQSLIRI